MPNLFVSVDGDSIGGRIGQASLANEVEETRRLSKLVNDANEIWVKWCLGVGGDAISAGGDECVLQVEASHLVDVPALRQQYLDLVGTTCTVGVGLCLAEAQKALFVGKLEGKDRIQMYDAQVELAFQQAREHFLAEDSAEVEKLGQEYLNTQDRSTNHPLTKSDDPHEQQLLDDAEAPHEAPSKKENPKDYEKEFHAAAERSGKNQSEAQAQQQKDELKQKVGGVLNTLRGQGETLQLLAQRKPELYNALNEMIQSMIEMGQQLFAKPEEKVAKSESKARGVEAKHEKCEHCGGTGDCKCHEGVCPVCLGSSCDDCGYTHEPVKKAEHGSCEECGKYQLERNKKYAHLHMFDMKAPDGTVVATSRRTQYLKRKAHEHHTGTLKAEVDPDEQDDQLDLDVEKGGPEGEIAPGRTKPVSEAFDKAAPVAARSNVVSPVGTVKQPGPGGTHDAGKLKVTHASGHDGWQGVRAGLVGSPTGRPTSARNPKGAPQDKPRQTPEHFEQDEAPG